MSQPLAPPNSLCEMLPQTEAVALRKATELEASTPCLQSVIVNEVHKIIFISQIVLPAYINTFGLVPEAQSLIHPLCTSNLLIKFNREREVVSCVGCFYRLPDIELISVVRTRDRKDYSYPVSRWSS